MIQELNEYELAEVLSENTPPPKCANCAKSEFEIYSLSAKRITWICVSCTQIKTKTRND